MKRRHFSLALLGAAAGGPGGALRAQTPALPQDGVQYATLNPPVALAVPPGGVEVLEFFSYACPHCAAFDPFVENWARRQDAKVSFRRVPVAFSPVYEHYQRLFHALEVTGQLAALHRKVFEAIHTARQPLQTPDGIKAFLDANGQDGQQMLQTLQSFAVTAKATQSSHLMEAYRIEGVPTLAVHGRWVTSPEMARSNEKAIEVLDFLVARARQQR